MSKTATHSLARYRSRLLWLLLSAAGLSGCQITQYLPEGKYLYDGAALEIETPSGEAHSSLLLSAQSVLDNSTNQRLPLLGYYEIYRHYRFQQKRAQRPEKFADREPWGRAPIFYDDELVRSIRQLLENRAANEGYFNSTTTVAQDTSTQPPQIATQYTLRTGARYRVDSLQTFWQDSSIARIINIEESQKRLRGQPWRLDALRQERQRWEDVLREEGFYYARASDFSFLADTSVGNQTVRLLARQAEDVPRNHRIPQRIAAINVRFGDAQEKSSPTTVTQDKGIRIFCDDCPLRPAIVDEAFAFRQGDLYHPEKHRKTLQRLAAYNTFRYIALDYAPSGDNDSLLVINARLQTRLPRRFEGEIGLTFNSANYVGPNAKLTYLNRNLLRGAELLRIEGEFSLARFTGAQNAARVPSTSLYGIQAQLNVPRLWLPKRRKLIPRVFTSGTVIEIGAKAEDLRLTLQRFLPEIEAGNLRDLQALVADDPEASERVSLTNLRFQFGYTWRRRVTKNHALNPLSIRLQNPVARNEEVLDLARRLNLAPGADGLQTSRFDRMLLYSPNYTYTLDTRLAGGARHHFFLRQYVSMNVNNTFPVGSRALRATETSLFPLLETDGRYYFTFSRKSQIATRFHGGIAFPIFSDRAIVPYFDLFSVGGPNSLRGFIPRQVGPGRTVPFANNLLTFGGYGNLLLEGSIEYRYQVNSLIELAAFVDAGNVWTYRTELAELTTDFRTEAFAGEVAANAGIGFRFDLEFLLLRIDLARPVATPYAENARQLRIPFADARDVPEDNLRLVVAFGYPF